MHTAYKHVLEWYKMCGVDVPLTDVAQNHYQKKATVKQHLTQAPGIIRDDLSTNQNNREMSDLKQNETMRESIEGNIAETRYEKIIENPQQISAPDPIVTNKAPPRNDLDDFKHLFADKSQHPALLCQTLDQLKYAIEHSTECDLIKAATHTVFSGGNLKADIMIIGEAPGADEDRLGQPFVGQSGQLLDTILATIGLTRDSIYISNIIPWRPPGNRPPNASEINFCLPFIVRHIEIKAPKILILLGGVAVKTLLGKNDGILKLRGQIFDYQLNHETAIAAMPTLHPSYIMRSPSQKALVWQDMLILKKWLREMTA